MFSYIKSFFTKYTPGPVGEPEDKHTDNGEPNQNAEVGTKRKMVVDQDKPKPPQQFKREKLAVPPGMSKNAFKKQQKKLYRDSMMGEWRRARKERTKERKKQKRELVEERVANGEAREDVIEEMYKKRIPKSKRNETQVDSKVNVVFDCSFNHKMKQEEIASMARQIARSYSENRRAEHFINTKLTCFEGSLKKYLGSHPGFEKWDHFEYETKDLDVLAKEGKLDLSKTVYLSADEDATVDELKEDYTYIIGGIVDKGRYKNLCYDKAKELGIPTARLPINEYFKIRGRKVLTSLHVYLLLSKWLECKDWKKAFDEVLPERKHDDDDDDDDNNNNNNNENNDSETTKPKKETEDGMEVGNEKEETPIEGEESKEKKSKQKSKKKSKSS
ncbi:tRNA (guanine(9)-N(1))-methyltransferase [Saccharomycopsis crataegensis]|uniref:tRNA (guanine(9)-N1)-methyltransferase n=1 Tax=Saccharomycopsis crataegensis TaxID=43959 RepID=A0AAV5QT32_9ASCO|nr:tRNA (guanine(9)-N(1))-methyltransferase [Saccharomycopsis crataegensis]